MTDNVLIPVDVDAAVARLAHRHRAASGVGLKLLNLVGAQAENLLERLPDPVKDQLEAATERALILASQAAVRLRGRVGDPPDWVNRSVATAMGVAGGVGGLPTALAELPLTTTYLLRTIQGIAAEHGFDAQDTEVQKRCLAVFASAGPLEADDGADMAFLSARVTLTGATVHGIIARVAPRLATVLGQKLAAQTVPVLGAAAGAATNYTYTRYYQEMAHVQFGLDRLAAESGRARDDLVHALRVELGRRS